MDLESILNNIKQSNKKYFNNEKKETQPQKITPQRQPPRPKENRRLRRPRKKITKEHLSDDEDAITVVPQRQWRTMMEIVPWFKKCNPQQIDKILSRIIKHRARKKRFHRRN